MKKFFFFIIFLCLFGIAYADMYQWVDDEGVVHFTNTPTEFSGDVEVGVEKEIETPDDLYIGNPDDLYIGQSRL